MQVIALQPKTYTSRAGDLQLVGGAALERLFLEVIRNSTPETLGGDFDSLEIRSGASDGALKLFVWHFSGALAPGAAKQKLQTMLDCSLENYLDGRWVPIWLAGALPNATG